MVPPARPPAPQPAPGAGRKNARRKSHSRRTRGSDSPSKAPSSGATVAQQMFAQSTAALCLAAVLLASTSYSLAFQQRHHRRWTSPTELLAKRKQAKPSAGGFSKGGFGSSKASANSPADPSKVRSVSGYTGSGTKVLAGSYLHSITAPRTPFFLCLTSNAPYIHRRCQ